MTKNIDHVTVVVSDVEEAKHFFSLLGFREDISILISGEKVSNYMGIPNMEAEHVTLVLENSSPRLEIQLLHFLNPTPSPDPQITNLNRFGYNHIALRVEDLEKEMKRLEKNGVEFKNSVMTLNNRKLVFFSGPGGITLELVEWKE